MILDSWISLNLQSDLIPKKDKQKSYQEENKNSKMFFLLLFWRVWINHPINMKTTAKKFNIIFFNKSKFLLIFRKPNIKLIINWINEIISPKVLILRWVALYFLSNKIFEIDKIKIIIKMIWTKFFQKKILFLLLNTSM